MSSELPKLLKLIIRNAPQGSYVAFFAAKPPHQPRVSFFPATLAGVTSLYTVAQAADASGRDCYLQPALLKAKPKTGRGNKAYVLGTSTLWTDIDHSDTPPLAPADFGDPTLLVRSGHGFHVYYALNEFCSSHKHIEAANKTIAKTLGGDSCWDVSRLLRIPGTHNHKEPNNAIAVEEVNFVLSQYSIDTFVPADFASTNIPATDVPPPEPLDEASLSRLSDELQELLFDVDHEPKDRSSFDYHMGRRLLKHGLTVGQIHSLMLDPETSISKKVLANDEPNTSYLEHTLLRLVAAKAEDADGTVNAPSVGPVLSKLIFKLRHDAEGKRKTEQSDTEWTEPCVNFLKNKYAVYAAFNEADQRQLFAATGSSTPDQRLVDTSSTQFEDWVARLTGCESNNKTHETLSHAIQRWARSEDAKPLKVRPWFTPHISNPHLHILKCADLQERLILDIELTNPLKTELYPNGSKGIYLCAGYQLREAMDPNPPEPSVTLSRLKELFTDYLAVSPVAREILTAYIIAAPLSRSFGVITLPILYFVGPAGCGKTQTLKLIATYFHGRPEVTSNATMASLYRQADREIFMPFDDYDTLSEETKSFILAATTGAFRQKSDGKTEIARQDIHILLSFTATTELPSEPLRRRSLRIEVSKTRYPGRTYFNEEHWKAIKEERKALDWAVMQSLGRAQLEKLKDGFSAYVKATEDKIPISSNKPLAAFLTLLYEVFVRTSKDLNMRPDPRGIQSWLEELKLTDQAELSERQDLSTLLELLFEAVLTEAQTFGIHWSDGMRKSGNPMLTDYTLDWRTSDGRLHLIGTTAQWLDAFRKISRGTYRSQNEVKVGRDFSNLIGGAPEHENNSKTSKTYEIGNMRLIHLYNAGRAHSSRGWDISVNYKEAENI